MNKIATTIDAEKEVLRLLGITNPAITTIAALAMNTAKALGEGANCDPAVVEGALRNMVQAPPEIEISKWNGTTYATVPVNRDLHSHTFELRLTGSQRPSNSVTGNSTF